MKVYRVAHKTARYMDFPSGPYGASDDALPRHAVNALWEMSIDHSGYDHPSPRADSSLRGIAAYERCGFNSLDALYEWFDGWSAVLAGTGFCVYVYEVPPSAVRVGEYGQAVFSAERANLVRTEPLKFNTQLSLFDMEECNA